MKNKDITSKINKKVKKLTAIYKIKDKDFVNDLCLSSIDEYNLNFDRFKDEKEAYKETIRSTKEVIKEISIDELDNRVFKYSIILSLIVFSYSVLMAIVGIIFNNVLYDFQSFYLVLFLFMFGVVIYFLITHNKRRKIDYFVTFVLFLAVIAIFLQDIFFLLRPRSSLYYFTLNYYFPGVLFHIMHYAYQKGNVTLHGTSTRVLFDPVFITSLFCLVVSLRKKYIAKKKNKGLLLKN